MRVHNFLVNYRKSHKVNGEESNEKSISKDDINSSGECPMVVGNDVGWCENIFNTEIDLRYRGLKLRESFSFLLAEHDIHRPGKEEWFEDDNMHVNRK